MVTRPSRNHKLLASVTSSYSICSFTNFSFSLLVLGMGIFRVKCALRDSALFFSFFQLTFIVNLIR